LVYTLLLTHHADDGSGGAPLAVVPPNPISSLRDSSLHVGVDALRTSNTIRSLGAADDYREAEHLWRAGNLPAAEILATRAVERDPRPNYRALLGVIVAQQEGRPNFKRGLALLDEVIAESPNDDRALVFRATVLRDAGRFDDAVRDWEAAVKANPNNDDAKLALRRAAAGSDTTGMFRLPIPVPARPSVPAPVLGGRNGWLLLGALVVATVALLVIYLRLRG
jgi:tetratricopeptide (TPR) repeat protein